MSPEALEPRKPFKEWFYKSAANLLAAQIGSVMPAFDRKLFVRLASRQLPVLEFAGRVRQFSDALARTLPNSTGRACSPQRKPAAASAWL